MSVSPASSVSSSSSRLADAGRARQQLLSRLLAAVKGCQAKFGQGGGQLATETAREVRDLLSALFDVLAHGMRDEVSPSHSFWPLVKAMLARVELDRFYLLAAVTSDGGRSSAWLRAALNERTLERQMLAATADGETLAKLYYSWAFLRDRERRPMLPTAAAGLSTVTFALKVDQDESETTIPPSSSRKKKYKTPSVVTLDDGSGDAVGSDTTSMGSHSPLPPSASPGPELEGAMGGGQSNAGLAKELAVKSTMEKRRSKSKASAMAAEVPRIDFTSASLVAAVGHGQQSADMDDDEEDDVSEGSGARTPNGSLSNQHAALTPVKAAGVGSLIPVKAGHAEEDLADASGGGDEDTPCASEDSASVHSLDESDYASACSTFHSVSRPASTYGGPVAGREIASSSVQSTGGISREDLKQALLSVMARKDELATQCGRLKKHLAAESESAAALKEEILVEKRRAEEAGERANVRLQALARENELLKHQLKKYVGAVQKLRDGPEAHETLAELEGKGQREAGKPKYVDYHFEASEYERKLIQVAEMHGELIE